jgi:hypothetical protein
MITDNSGRSTTDPGPWIDTAELGRILPTLGETIGSGITDLFLALD